MGISHLRAPRGFACGPLKKLRDKTTRGERARRRKRDPIALKLPATHERQRKRAIGNAVSQRKFRDKRNSRTNARARESAPRRLGHAGHDGRKGLGRPREHAREHASAEFALLAPDREGCGKGKERHARGTRRKPIEIVDQPRVQRGGDRSLEHVRVDAFKRSWASVRIHARERDQGLPPQNTPVRGCRGREFEKARDVKVAVSHAKDSQATTNAWRVKATREVPGFSKDRVRAIARGFVLGTRPVIVLDNVTKRFGPKILFENVSMQLAEGGSGLTEGIKKRGHRGRSKESKAERRKPNRYGNKAT